MHERVLSISSGELTRDITVHQNGTVDVDAIQFRVSTTPSPGEMLVSNGMSVSQIFTAIAGDIVWAFQDGLVFELTIGRDAGSATGATASKRRAHHAGSLTAPMPATVVSIHAKPGERVRRGAILILLEAMKMELPVRAPADGTVATVNCSPGDLVQPGVSLIELQ
jgi:acetyl/propionyl-CoA carboxylase alpha subunit